MAVSARLDGDGRRAALGRHDVTSESREAMLEALFASASDLLILPIQDVFGWRDRINQPATVSDATGRGDCRGRADR